MSPVAGLTELDPLGLNMLWGGGRLLWWYV